MYDMYSFTWSCTYSTISASPSKFSITFHSLGIFWHCFWCFWCFGVGLPVCLRLQCPWGHWMEILFSSSRRMTSPRSPRGMSASDRVHRTNIPGWMRHKLNSLGLNFQRPAGNCTRRRPNHLPHVSLLHILIHLLPLDEGTQLQFMKDQRVRFKTPCILRKGYVDSTFIADFSWHSQRELSQWHSDSQRATLCQSWQDTHSDIVPTV